MMSAATRAALNAETAAAAAAAMMVPLEIWTRDEITRIPNLGDYRPEGYYLTRVFFVDGTGMGSANEPAYTLEELKDRLVIGRGYAIIEEGQFQLHIGEFVRVSEWEAHAERAGFDLSGRATFSPEGWGGEK